MLIDSSPPASTMSAAPARIWSAAIITALSAEPHILLTVVAGTPCGTPAAERRLARRCLAEVGRQHAAHDHFLHVAGGDAGGLDRGLGGGGAELHRAQRRQDSKKRTDRGAFGGDDDDFWSGHVWPRFGLKAS